MKKKKVDNFTNFDSEESKEDDKEEIDKEKETSPAFNSAIDSLGNITAIVRQNAMISVSTDIPEIVKQKKRISLLRNLLICSILLAPEKLGEEFKEEILRLRPTSRMFIKGGVQVQTVIFDWDLDIKIDEYFMKILLILQKKGYFMPPRKDDDGL